MKLPIAIEGLDCEHPEGPARPVPRIKSSLGTSLCAGSSPSWALARRKRGPYRFSDECFCLSPEQHGAQFRREGWELRPLKGHC